MRTRLIPRASLSTFAIMIMVIALLSTLFIIATPNNAQAKVSSFNTSYNGAKYSGWIKFNSKGKVSESSASYERPVSLNKTKYTVPKTIKVKIGKKVRAIPVTSCNFSFKKCTKAKSITINASFQSQGILDFRGCKNLATLKLSNLKSAAINEYSFKGCKKLKSVYVGGSIDYIGDRSFYKFKKLKSFKCASIKSIGAKAFYNCNKLTIFKSKNGVLNNIGMQAFSGCSSLSSFPTLGYSTNLFVSGYDGGPSNVSYTHLYPINIGYEAFLGCKKLKTFAIDVSCDQTTNSKHSAEVKVSVDGRAFANCTELTSFSILGSKKNYLKQSASFQDGVFVGCYKLTQIRGIDILDDRSGI